MSSRANRSTNAIVVHCKESGCAAPAGGQRGGILLFVAVSIVAAVVPITVLRAQSEPLSDTTRVVSAAADTVAVPDALSIAPLKAAKFDTAGVEYVPTKSAGLAILLSAVLPGAGQTYNESYWKIPVVVGFGVWLGSQWLSNNRQMKDWREQYAASITVQNPGGNSRYQQLREFYKDQRDTYTWYLFIWYMLTLVDSYVDASLYDFNVGNDLSVRLLPTNSLGFKVQLSF